MPLRSMTALLTVLAAYPQSLDLTHATVMPAGTSSGPERKAVEMLIEEVHKRTGIRWQTGQPAASSVTIAVGLQRAVSALVPEASNPRTDGPEGFSNGIAPSGTVYVAGHDPRGVLFGIGHLLRHLEMRRGSVRLPRSYAVNTAPQTRLRGHQLGYRPKTNSYDGWTIAMWEQYIRDLIVFGTNAIELIPPRSDDAPDSPHFPQSQIETMVAMSRIADEYGMDVWIWYPAMDDDYSDPKTVESALREWGDVFKQLPRVNAVLVPAGDPGHTPAPVLLPFLEKQSANLRKHHPNAQLWLAPQGFDEKNINFFFDAVAKRPAWLSGITYGPQTRISLPELRKRLPREMEIRHYPDITHTRQSQYPVPDWDAAHALTSSREPINPRPVDQASIFRTQQPHTMGFITYSEGCNDDVNKIIWSGLGWDSSTAVMDILREYSRYFIGPDYADDFAHGLLALEANWRGRILTNGSIENTLAQFQALEHRASPRDLLNWRFQQALYRAYYDAYIRSRALAEAATEDRAMEALRQISDPELAMDRAERLLDAPEAVAADLRARVFQLAEALYQSIRMQLSVNIYKGMSGRGNTLDSVDMPLNSRVWLKQQFTKIRKLPDARDQHAQLDRLVHWTDPGPGGFYDDLGNPERQPHLIAGTGFDKDPQFFHTPLAFFDPSGRGRKSWWDQIVTLYEQPLLMKYEQLDRESTYTVRVVYGAGPIRLQANGAQELHGYIEKPFEVLEFPVPAEATRFGSLTLQWNRPPGAGGAGRGCQVAEVWLVKSARGR